MRLIFCISHFLRTFAEHIYLVNKLWLC